MNTSTVATVALLCTLFASCQGITKAPEGSKRVEAEVVVDIAPSFTEAVEGLDEDYASSATDLVLARADMGLRFYPVLTSEYGDEDARPQYFMTVELRDLVVDLDHEMVEEKDQEPRIVTSVSRIRCIVATSVKKRRQFAPDLTVGSATGAGSAKPTRPDRLPESSVTYEVVRRGEDGASMRVARSDIDKAVDQALATALRGLLEPIDREFAMTSGAQAGSAGN